MQYPEYVSVLIERLEGCGFESYIVGGSVRDMLIGNKPHDFDITTAAHPENVIEIFSDMRTIPTGLRHGTISVISDGECVEITTFRIDGEYTDSRRPKSVDFTPNIEEDLARRDFCVNAMAYNEKRGLVDPFGGQADLKRKMIRAVGEPEKRFSEDALRIMRAFRFSAKLGFCIEKETLNAAKKLAPTLENIARERISYEFLQLICAPEPSSALKEMRDGGVLSYVAGEYHPSDFVIESLCRAKQDEKIRLGIFLCECSDSKIKEILSSLKLSNKLSSNVFTIAERLKKPLSGGSVEARRFIGSCGSLAFDIISASVALGRCDAEFEKLVIENISKKVCTKNSELAIGGSSLVALGFSGREVGAVLDYLLDCVIEHPEINTEDGLISLAKAYKQHKI